MTNFGWHFNFVAFLRTSENLAERENLLTAGQSGVL
jgi:hypothetical protein